jgi:fatty-acyl-CoA synthase
MPHQPVDGPSQACNDKASSAAVRDITLGTLLKEAAEMAGDRVALVHGVADAQFRRRWTYAQLFQEAQRVARALLGRFQPGDRIAICAANCPEWILLQHGVALAGMVLVPINPLYRRRELADILTDCGAAVLFHAERWRDNDLGLITREIIANELPDLVSISLETWPAFVESGDPEQPLPVVTPDATALIQFTSGTTGRPKGAVLCHRGILNPPRYVAERIGFPEGGVWINAMPMYHIGGSVLTSLATLNLRGTFVLMTEWDPRLTLELVESERGNGMLLVPTMVLALVDHPDRPRYDLSSLNFILTGAAAVPPSLVERVRETLSCELMITFGQTEASGTVSTTGVGDAPRDLAETLGRPLPNVDISIRDPGTGAPLAPGETGEIWFRGFQVMLGYYGREAETREVLGEDGWLRSGDLGSLDDRGYLSIKGRLKDLIIRGGMNIYPREIEDVLFAHPAVAQIAVIGVEDAKWGEIVAAVVQLASGHDALPVEELDAFCRSRLAPHKVPILWSATDALPMTASGKVQKFALQDHIRAGALDLQPGPRRSAAG